MLLRADVLRALLVAPAGPLTRLEVVPRTGSTNDDVLADPDAWPDGAVLVADHQVGGHGRLGRSWEAPAGTSLTATFVVRPEEATAGLGWLGLLAGLGVVRALRATAGVAAGLKWPNDVLVELPGAPPLDGWGTARKVAGILAQATPDGRAVAVGVGLNVSQRADELPVPWATSLRLAGAADADRETLLVALVRALAEVAQRWRAAGGDVLAAGLADEVAGVCLTLGRPVRVDLPGDRTVTGEAVRLDADGALVVREGPVEQRVLAGDVRHLRRG